ncbi:MAG TPA: cell wall-binding repeat-containing protein [Acidothermaceae bacterium]
MAAAVTVTACLGWIVAPVAAHASTTTLTILSVARDCSNLGNAFSVNASVAGDAPNASRHLAVYSPTLNRPLGQSAFTTDANGNVATMNFELGSQGGDLLPRTSLDLEVFLVSDPSEITVAQSGFVLPACDAGTIDTVTCLDHAAALGTPICTGSDGGDPSKYLSISGSTLAGGTGNAYTVSARQGYEITKSDYGLDSISGDVANGDGSTPQVPTNLLFPLGEGDFTVQSSTLANPSGTYYIYRLVLSVALYPGASVEPTGRVVTRIAGPDRFQTASAAAQWTYLKGGAGAVVLARGDQYADALVGAPLAAAKNAPLLLTSGSTLPAITLMQLERVLPPGGTVYLLGGDAAIPASVQTQLTTAGYQTTRYAGANRYATAVAVADALGDPATVLLTTGLNFPDGLAAGPAAAHIGAAVLLTDGGVMPPETEAYLTAHATTTYAAGGPAVAADPSATAVEGADRYATAAAIAARFFSAPAAIGMATGANFPDALSGGAALAHLGRPLLLTDPAALPSATTAYLAATPTVAAVTLFGSTTAISANVASILASPPAL